MRRTTHSSTLLIPHPEVSEWLHFSALGSNFCFLAHTGTWSSTLPLVTQPVPPHPKMPGKLVPLHKQAPKLLLPEGLVPLCLQQLLWLLEAHTTVQVDPRASAALWARFKPTSFMLQGHPRLAI
jgi:hypothetical protein